MDRYLSSDDSIVNYCEIDHLKLSLPLKDDIDEENGDSFDQVIIFNVFKQKNLFFLIKKHIEA